MFKNVNRTNYIEGVHYDLLKLSSGKTVKVGFENKHEQGGRVDLHVHSTSSDGSLSPEEIIRLAILSNIRTLAITDHDILDGSKQLLSADPRGLELYSGIEFTALVRHGKSRIHILGYDFDLNDDKINKAVEYVDKCSEYNFRLYIRCLEEEYPEIDIPKFEIDKILENRKRTHKNIGRVDIAQLLIKYGYGEDPLDEYPKTFTKQDIVFERYLNPIKYLVQEEKLGISAEECIEIIKSAGGLVSLAHPSSLRVNNEKLREIVKHYKECGLDSLEVYHPNNNSEMRRYYYDLAKKENLLISGGTDFHGYEVKPDIILGHGRNGNIDIRENDLTLVKALRKRR